MQCQTKPIDAQEQEEPVQRVQHPKGGKVARNLKDGKVKGEASWTPSDHDEEVGDSMWPQRGKTHFESECPEEEALLATIDSIFRDGMIKETYKLEELVKEADERGDPGLLAKAKKRVAKVAAIKESVRSVLEQPQQVEPPQQVALHDAEALGATVDSTRNDFMGKTDKLKELVKKAYQSRDPELMAEVKTHLASLTAIRSILEQPQQVAEQAQQVAPVDAEALATVDPSSDRLKMKKDELKMRMDEVNAAIDGFNDDFMVLSDTLERRAREADRSGNASDMNKVKMHALRMRSFALASSSFANATRRNV